MMPRQDAFAHLKQDAQEPVKIIPLARKKKRDNRAWDRAHRGMSYHVPSPLREKAKDVRAAILGLAHQHMTNSSSVAAALMGFSLAHVRLGKLTVEARPNATRRKMSLTWEEADEWPQEIQTVKHAARSADKDLVLTYRWGGDLGKQIKALAGEEICIGEVVLYLLQYAIDAHRSGRLRLKEEVLVISKKVSPTW
jgi:hypothetical protein